MFNLDKRNKGSAAAAANADDDDLTPTQEGAMALPEMKQESRSSSRDRAHEGAIPKRRPQLSNSTSE